MILHRPTHLTHFPLQDQHYRTLGITPGGQ